MQLRHLFLQAKARPYPVPFILRYTVPAPSHNGLDATTVMPEPTQVISDGKLDEDPDNQDIDYEDEGEDDETVPPQTGIISDSGPSEDE